MELYESSFQQLIDSILISSMLTDCPT